MAGAVLAPLSISHGSDRQSVPIEVRPTGFYAQEEETWSRQAMTASVAVLTGAGAVALLRYNAADPASVWFYPIGLVTGFGFGTIWADVDVEEDEDEN